MNRSLLLGILLIACFRADAQYLTYVKRTPARTNAKPSQPFRVKISGSILNAENSKKLYLFGTINGEITLKDGNTFSLKDEAYTSGSLFLQTDNSEQCRVWVSKGKIEITLVEYTTPRDTTGKRYLKVVNLSGPPETEQYQLFMNKWNELLSNSPFTSTKAKRDSAANIIYPEIESYIQRHPASELSAFLLQSFSFSVEQKQKLLSLLDPDKIKAYDRIKERLEMEAALRPGTVLPDFKQKLPDGSDFNLHSVKAKYILLRFWESGCTSCREENAELLGLYNEYRFKGLEIVNISLDQEKDAWISAVAQDALPWIQISDLRGSNNEIASACKIKDLPHIIILNSQFEVVSAEMPIPILPIRLKYLFRQM